MTSNKRDFKKIVESLYKLERKVADSILVLKLESETHVPDLMTKIRVLIGVAVVGQREKVTRYVDGDAMLIIGVKYLPQTDEIYEGLKALCKMIKKLPGVKTITVREFNKKAITLKGKKIIF